MEETEDTKTSAVQLVIDLMMQLTEERRLEVIAEFCQSCGIDDPRCQCENDD